MDTTVNPAITFPTAGEDLSQFVTPTGLVWNGDSRLIQTYSTPAGLTLPNIDVAIDGARDSKGEAQLPFFQADVFSMPFIAATHVTDMSGEVLGSHRGPGEPITDADVGKTIAFLVRWEISTDFAGCSPLVLMDPACLDLTFPNIGYVPASLQSPTSTWQTRSRYRHEWTIVDGNEEHQGIDVYFPGGVVGRKDDSPNTAPGYLLLNVFDIDTKNPTVVSLASDIASITSSAVGGELTLTVEFSEAMNPTSVPALTFPNQDVSSLLTATTGSWTDSTHFAQKFQVNQTSVAFAGVDVQVSDGRDAPGNLQVVSTASAVFAVDLPAPTATLTATVTPSPTPTVFVVDRVVLRADNPRVAGPDGRISLWASNVSSGLAQSLMTQLLGDLPVVLEVTDSNLFAVRLPQQGCKRYGDSVRCPTHVRGRERDLLVLRRRASGAYQLTIFARELAVEQTGTLPPVGPISVQFHAQDAVGTTLTSCDALGPLLRCTGQRAH